MQLSMPLWKPIVCPQRESAGQSPSGEIMAYSKVWIPTEVYHLTMRENLESILANKRIRRFGDTECWSWLDMDK